MSQVYDWVGRPVIRGLGMFGLMYVRQDQVYDWIYYNFGWVEWELLITYEKYLMWDTEWISRYNKAENGAGKVESSNQELKKHKY